MADKSGAELSPWPVGKLLDVDSQVGVGTRRNSGGPRRRNLDLAVLVERPDRRIA